jgi:hypothetical protein
MRRYHAIRSGGMGAEPLPAISTWSRPRPVRTFLATILPRMGIFSSRSSLAGGILANTPCWNLSHSRGTLMNRVGRARCRSARKVSSASAKNIWVRPSMREEPSIQVRSKMCDSGR